MWLTPPTYPKIGRHLWTFPIKKFNRCVVRGQISDFFRYVSLKNIKLEAHFLLLVFFDKIHFLTTLLLKLGQIFDKVAKLGKSTQDAYNTGKCLIL